MKFATFVNYATESSDEKKDDGYILIQEGRKFERIDHQSKEDFGKYLQEHNDVKKF